MRSKCGPSELFALSVRPHNAHSSLRCDAVALVLRPINALIRVTKIDARVSSCSVFHSSSNRSQRPYCAFPHAFTLFRSQWERQRDRGRCDRAMMSQHRGSALLVADRERMGTLSAVDSLLNCSQRPCCVFPCASVLFRSQCEP